MDIAKIVSTAKEKIGSTSLSDRTLTEYFTVFNPQSEPDDAFWDQHSAVLRSMSGQFSHDVAAWQKKWMEDHPEPKPVEQQQQQGIDPSVQAILDGYKTQMEEMKGLLAKQQQQQSSESLRNGAIGMADSIKVVNKNIWNDAVNRVSITEGMTADQFNAAVKTTYEQNLKSFVGDGVQPYGNANPADQGAKTKAQLDAFFASKGIGASN